MSRDSDKQARRDRWARRKAGGKKASKSSVKGHRQDHKPRQDREPVPGYQALLAEFEQMGLIQVRGEGQ